MPTKPARPLTRRLAALGVLAGGVTVTAALAQPPAAKPQPAPAAPTAAAQAEDYNRPVAYLNGNQPVTRRDLGEFLMARGGADKIDLLLNKMIIETEAKRLGITVTETEMEAAFLSDLEGLGEGGVKKGDFINMVLPKYGKTLYEWMEDVIRPRLLLSKMILNTIKVTEAEVQVQFEREYGEKRAVQIIMWPKGDDPKAIFAVYEKIRGNPTEFDRAAQQQANPSLAAALGKINPLSRHTYAQDKQVVDAAFLLAKPGDVSHVIGTSQGMIVMKLLGVIPPDAKIDPKAVKARLEKQAFDEKLTEAIPAHFKTLRDKAAPSVLYTGPSAWAWNGETKDAINGMLKQSVTPAGGTAPAPMPSAPAATPPAGGKVPTPGNK